MTEHFACNVQHLSFCHAKQLADQPNTTHYIDLHDTYMNQKLVTDTKQSAGSDIGRVEVTVVVMVVMALSSS